MILSALTSHAMLAMLMPFGMFATSCVRDSLDHCTGLTNEGNCTWCEAGKYQTGVSLIAEANCTWCVAGKYQTGSGVHMTD
jgi:hypothetical protein